MSPSPLSLNTMTFPQDAQTPFMSPNYASTSTFQGANGETGYVDVANSQTFMHMPSSNALGLSGMQLETASPTSPRVTPFASTSNQAIASPLFFTPGIQAFFSPQRGSPLIQRDDPMGADMAVPTPEVATPNTLGLYNMPMTNPRALPTVEENLPPPAPLLATVPLPQDVVVHPPVVSIRRVFHRAFGRNQL